ncbi:MAG: N-acetyltransferase, partial [Candidatus Omnitrophica bacterium]|nr:N-acetyltransferase [Candidatus Omnitrophota bacterium]
MNLRTIVVRKIEEIPPKDWLAVFPHVLENYYFFKTLDESSIDQFSLSYIMVYDGDTPIGATSCFLMRFPLHITVTGFLRKFYEGLNKIFHDLLTPRVLMCGLPMGQGRIGVRGEPARVIEVIRVALDEIASREKASLIIFKDFVAAYDSLLAPLTKRGFSKIESLPSTGMKISWKSFDEYLKSLSRVSRDGLKRKYKKTDAAVKIECEELGALDESTVSEVYGLYMQTFIKLDMGFEKLTPEFFRHVSVNMPREVKYFLWRIDGKLV